MDPIARARLNASLLEILAELLSRRVRDPRVDGVTITGVEVSGDLAVAKVFYSLLGDAEQQRIAQRGLEKASGFLRGEIGRALRLRTTPELRFRFDSSLAQGQRIEGLLREWQQQAGAAEPPASEPRPGEGEEGGDA